MDVTTIRRLNIAMLVEQSGGPTAFGEKVERSQIQVSQWTSTTKPKPIGGNLARGIEENLGLEHGWLDRPQWTGESALLQHSQSMRLDPNMIAATHKTLRDLCHERGYVYNIEDDPVRFVLLYQEKMAMPANPTPAEEMEFDKKLAVLAPQGAIVNGRGVGVPAKGAGKKNVARGVRRK
jgi:hypothetical protein